MSDGGHPGDADDRAPAGWPVTLSGVTESVVATEGPEGRWNQAALGLFAPDHGGPGSPAASAADGVTARTWGETRTRRNFARAGGGVVQFTTDPREFVDAALSVTETDEPVRPGAAAWAEVDVERLAAGEVGGTRWRDWRLHPVASEVRRERVPTINRGFNAVVEATVVASRLDVGDGADAEALVRLAYLADVVEAAGGPAEREAMTRLDAVTGWRERLDRVG